MRAALLWPVVGMIALSACSRPVPSPDPVRAVRTVTVDGARAAPTYEFAGEVHARIESRLSFRVGGKMTRRLVNLGDTVKAGQPLAQLDPQDLLLGQDAARATVAVAQAALDQNAAEFQRYRHLAEQGFIGPAELDRRETALKTARAQFAQAQAQAQVQGNQAAYATLSADASGVVTGVDLEPGMVAAAGMPVLRLAHDGPRDIVFEVPEDRVALVKELSRLPGRFEVRLWGERAGAWPVRVREIAAAADPATRTFQVKADLGEGAGHPVRLGQTATVRMMLPETDGVTKLPLSALREERGHSAVWVVEPATMTVRSQTVVVGGADGNEAVIASGLSPGQVVVTAGVHVLSPGQKVTQYRDPSGPGAVAAAPMPLGP